MNIARLLNGFQKEEAARRHHSWENEARALRRERDEALNYVVRLSARLLLVEGELERLKLGKRPRRS